MLTELGSLVVLGDSISSGYGVTQPYATVLSTRLANVFGDVDVYMRAYDGAQTGDLLIQIETLPEDLPAPVLVLWTAGGNDMLGNIDRFLSGEFPQILAEAQQHVGEALTALETRTTGELYVVGGNVYDPSDATGDFTSCPYRANLPQAVALFDLWNNTIAAEVTVHGQTMLDVHAAFLGHGIVSDDRWISSDCIHPNQVGHNALANIFAASLGL